MKRPDDDVHLTDGDGFMVQEGPFQAHLKVAKEIKQVPVTFSSGWAISLMILFYPAQDL